MFRAAFESFSASGIAVVKGFFSLKAEASVEVNSAAKTLDQILASIDLSGM
jgi:hypothetical protein